MDTITTTDMAKWIGKSVNRALQNPLGLTIRDEVVAVVVSKYEWDRLKGIEQTWVKPDWHRAAEPTAIEQIAAQTSSSWKDDLLRTRDLARKVLARESADNENAAKEES